MGKAVLPGGHPGKLGHPGAGGALVVAIAFIVVNTIVDMLYQAINPGRIRSMWRRIRKEKLG